MASRRTDLHPLRRTAVSISDEEAVDSVPAESFKAAFRLHPAGVAVVTADSGDGPVAMTVSSLSSVSTEPPLLVFSVSATSSSSPSFARAETVVVHMLATDQLSLARLWATSGTDRFADTSVWARLPTGEPVFPAAYAWLRGNIVQRIEAGNSVLCLVHVIETSLPQAGKETSRDGAGPLVYHARTWHHLGDHSKL
ncbi:flavin reductase family protein [Streptomyces sp. NPDC005799]|uniref:flavin reductase family protein n=1 Tax=Streptomyces sp. NPDC005799 TaxID=3154678 RepID=UPI0034013B56